MIDDLRQVSREHGEPTWFTDNRISAADLIDKLPLPDMQRFKYDDLPLVSERKLQFTNQKNTIDYLNEESNVINQVNQESFVRLDADLIAKGVILTDLFTAMKKYPDLVKKYLNTVTPYNEDKLSAYNQAYMNTGAFLYVPDDVEIDTPIEANIIQNTELMATSMPMISHILIVVGKRSKLNFIQQLSSSVGERNLINLVVEVVVEDGANISFSALDETELGTLVFFNRRASVGRDAHIEWNVAFMNNDNTIGDLASELIGEGSYANSKAIAVTTGNQKLVVNNRVINRGPHSTGLINQRGVLLENSKLIFNGIGQIIHGAHGSKADQQNRVLMMSDHAQGDANPLLLIDENDVIAAHAASVGPVDQIQLDYLMSRGIPFRQAERMVIHGFLDAVLGSISKGNVRDRMLKLLERKLIIGQNEYYDHQG
ncbi:Fe-S cluster assembly protein SufD [Lactobacillus kalixensis]|uniref:FeS assembly protein SufD n=1 Tax=Lactobacillus kalixensis DSM 16043 TaxID=1423763 RepID=A0A0R1UA19_9LACO|nr:Fe-S cluster assembly protein SufD [Lactobacillus kalixensis]KRL90173.1 hypothetical protein FC46_GL000359 [Lactobacillus kalixensis DSM 16043]